MAFSDFGVFLGDISRAQINHTTKNPLKAQKNVLKKIVRRNKNCEYGKKINLKDVHSIEDYQKIVLLSTYSDYEPYVDRMMNNGEKRLIFNGINVRYASSSGSVGKPKMLPILNEDYAISANVIVIKPKENALYLYYTLKSEYVDKEVDLSIHSTSQPAFGMEKIRSLMVKKPLKDEQEIISEIISQFDGFIHQNKLEINKLSSTKQGLLSDLITGKVRI